MKLHLPNLLTLSRLPMAVVIFALLGAYDAGSSADAWLLDAALVVFIVAGLTDVLDGYLARRFGVASDFGRISDPFIDKVLICGAFAYFAGVDFTVRDAAGDIVSLTGVAVWMAVLIFARELLVTGVRGFSESQGKAFATTAFGKAKMALQSLTIIWVLLTATRADGWGSWARVVRDVLVWATVIYTALSALVYARRIQRLLTPRPEPQPTKTQP